MKNLSLVILYLTAIVAANLLVARFGPSISILNAFLFIGLDITTRDYLHEVWHSKLWFKMGLLIGCGSLLSWLLNKNAGQIALASFSAFALAAIIDTLVYSILRRKHWLIKVNGSNILSALVDSVAFPTIAFGSFLPLIVLGQFAAKVGGGFIWSLILRRTNRALVNTVRA